MSSEPVEVGEITHFYPKVSVAVIQLTSSLKVGDRILVRGATTNIEQTVESMQIEHANVPQANAGQSVGIRTVGRVREKDTVYKLQ